MKTIDCQHYSIRYVTLWLFCIGALITQCFGLVDRIGPISLNDLAVIVCGVGSIYYIIKYWNVSTKYGLAILFMFVAILSSVQAHYIYGQSFMLGFRAQRFSVVCWLMYIALGKLVIVKKLTLDQLTRIVYLITSLQFIVCVIQYVLGPGHYIMITLMTQSYFGMRIYLPLMFIILSFAVSLDAISRNRPRLIHIYMFLISIFLIVRVDQSRMNMIAVIVISFVVILLRGHLSLKKVLLVIASLTILVLFARSSLISELIHAIQGNDKTGSVMTRYAAQDFYLEALRHNPFLGWGYINTTYQNAYELGGLQQGFNLVDNGIFGFVFFYGVIGLVWAILLFLNLFRNAYYSLKNDFSVVLIVVLFFLIGITNVTYWFYEWYAILSVITLVISTMQIS